MEINLNLHLGVEPVVLSIDKYDSCYFGYLKNLPSISASAKNLPSLQSELNIKLSEVVKNL